MAYRIKTISYLGTDRKILLQNENGPCPLIACANALLLGGKIDLPPKCVRNDVASIEDLINLLADRALKKISTNTHHEYHMNDLLTVFPLLQYGMDLNPKFTSGPFGVEYTKNVELFDLLGVELCHGWLLDPQDIETTSVIDGKSYNESAYMVIQGKDAFAEIHHLEESIASKEDQLQMLLLSSTNETAGAGSGTEIAQSSAVIEKPEVDSTLPPIDFKNESADVDLPFVGVDCTSNALDTCSEIVTEMMSTEDGLLFTPSITYDECQRELSHQRNLHEKMTLIASKGAIIDTFLLETSHQLTYYGIHELIRALTDDSLYVFFRNNHFATITKHDSGLFLLVTDLGYGNVTDVVWEKLDNIDGDTEYFDSYFQRTPSKVSFAPTPGPSLSPELLLAQSGQTGADYHIALQLSENEGKSLDEQEGWLLHAATEQSIVEWTNEQDKAVNFMTSFSPVESSKQEETDEAVALKLAAQFESERLSEHLAQRLHAEEQWRAAEHRRTSSSIPSRKANRTNCVIC